MHFVTELVLLAITYNKGLAPCVAVAQLSRTTVCIMYLGIMCCAASCTAAMYCVPGFSAVALVPTVQLHFSLTCFYTIASWDITTHFHNTPANVFFLQGSSRGPPMKTGFR